MHVLVAVTPVHAAAISPVSERIVCAVHDQQDMQVPDRVTLGGWIGARITANEHNRLASMDVDRLLEGYRKRPGRQSWDGEHVGKWLHAATLAWVNTGDPALRKRLDYVVAELSKCQLEDGYLGTYLKTNRWTEWDVWAHKYNLIGLTTYMRYTGNMAPMPGCRKMADLLCNTFGDLRGQRDILQAGQHMGLAPTSVLEPMVLLSRMTGEPRYLDFCKYILRSWERPNGPKIISTLLRSKRVVEVGNAKAYEMLSCLNGALEYYRTVGDHEILQACLNAWQDIVDHHLYPTGTASYREHFHSEGDLPNVNNVGETCVTVTWLQFNAQLLRLTGEARFAEQLEKVVLNQLFGAQRCDGTAWGYYVQMEGKKPYSSVLDGHCCLSSGPRGVSLIPTFAVSTDEDGVVFNLYEASTVKLKLRNGPAVTLATETRYPSNGHILIRVNPEKKSEFKIKLRIPGWCSNWSVQINGSEQSRLPRRSGAEAGDRLSSAALAKGDEGAPKVGPDGYVALHREWKKGDLISLDLDLQPRVLAGSRNNEGKLALVYGPLVLAADEALLPPGLTLRDVGFARADLSSLHFAPEPARSAPVSGAATSARKGRSSHSEPLERTDPAAPGNGRTPFAWSQVYQVDAITRKSTQSLNRGSPIQVRLLPFAEAGGTGSAYKVWLPYGTPAANRNLLLEGVESRSRKGNVGGSIIDGDVHSIAVTFNGKPARQDWFAVTLDEPVTVGKVVFVHGQTFHDGGWFDTSAGKPRVEIRTSAGGGWESVGALDTYPGTTTSDAAGLKGGESFALELKQPREIVGIRVIGKPACGDNLEQAFSSCAELQAVGTSR